MISSKKVKSKATCKARSRISYEMGAKINLALANIDYDSIISLGEENKVTVETHEMSTNAKIYMNVTSECRLDEFGACVSLETTQKALRSDMTILLDHVGHGVYEGVYTVKTSRIGAITLVFFTMQSGLVGNVYRNRYQQRPSVKKVHDGKLDFDWDTREVHGVQHEDVSIRWKGKLVAPESRTYQFKTQFDDAFRLFIDGELKVDYDVAHGGFHREFSIFLYQGTHDLVIEYAEYGRHANMRLWWKHPAGSDFEIIDQQYFRSIGSVVASSSIQATCFPGTFLNKNTNECEECPAGKCQKKPGKTYCEDC